MVSSQLYALYQFHCRAGRASPYGICDRDNAAQDAGKCKDPPFKISYYCERRDPDFDSKMHDVLVIYKQLSLQFDEDGNLRPFEGMPVHTLSYDEKPGMQALDTTADDRPPVPSTEKNSTVYQDYEYVRLGTLSLLAAIDLLTGEAVPLVSPTHKSSDFVRFLKMLDEKYPAGDKIRLILDNHSAHTSRETQNTLIQYPEGLNLYLRQPMAPG